MQPIELMGTRSLIVHPRNNLFIQIRKICDNS